MQREFGTLQEEVLKTSKQMEFFMKFHGDGGPGMPMAAHEVPGVRKVSERDHQGGSGKLADDATGGGRRASDSTPPARFSVMTARNAVLRWN